MTPQERMALISKEIGMDFPTRQEWVGEVKTNDRRKIDVPNSLEGFMAPFTPSEWVHLAQREGEFYVGGCCGNMGALQDIMATVFRDGGWIDASTFHRMAHYAKGHDGFEEWDPMDDERFARSVDEWAYTRREHSDVAVDPWAQLGIIYNAVSPLLAPSKGSDTPVLDPRRPQRPEALVYETFSHTMWQLDWHTLYTRPDDPKRAATHDAAGILLRARALPALRLLLADIEALDETWNGYALIRTADGSLMDTWGGYCLYGTREDAEEVLGWWAKEDDFDPTAVALVEAFISIPTGLVLGTP